MCQIVADLVSGLLLIHGILFGRWKNLGHLTYMPAEEVDRVNGCWNCGCKLETKISRP